jgi:hypothetical protein
MVECWTLDLIQNVVYLILNLQIENVHSKIKLSKYRNTTDILKELKLSTSQIDLLKIYV